MDLNKAMVIGNLTRDPETRTTPSGQNVCNFSIATNRFWKDKQTGEKKQAVEYHNIVVWGKLADICQQYLKKGKQTYIEGRIQTRTWEDQGGAKRNRTEIVAENMIMLSRDGSPAAGGPPVDAEAESQGGQPPTDNGEEIKVEDIPF